MKRTFQLFWQRGWDNLVHLVIFNLVWFTLSLPFLFGLVMFLMVLGPETSPPDAPAEAPAREEAASEGPLLSEHPAAGEPAAGEKGARESPLEFLERASRERMAAHGRRLGLVLLYLACCWVLFCVATGYVFFAMADIVAEYDFGGYGYITRRFLRRGPILRSIAAVTLCGVTLAVSLANIVFYLYLAAARGLVFILLAGIMAWFVLLVIMTFALAMPLVAQRGMRLLPAVRTAAILALSAPLRTFFVVAAAGVVAIIAICSLAGFGFFVVSAPAVLFNAEVRSRLEEIERPRGTPAAGEDAGA